MTFRNITIDDYEGLIIFWKENYFVNEMDNLERLRLFLGKNPGLSILVEVNGTIVGTALGSFDGRRGYLQKLVVSKNIRNQGVGKKLVERIIKKLQTLSATYIPIAVEKEYVSFYINCGFKITEQVPMKINIKQ